MQICAVIGFFQAVNQRSTLQCDFPRLLAHLCVCRTCGGPASVTSACESPDVHLTLTEAIHRQRVRAAEKLLLNDAASLTEVAARCGFNDVGYFRQIFSKHTG